MMFVRELDFSFAKITFAEHRMHDCILKWERKSDVEQKNIGNMEG